MKLRSHSYRRPAVSLVIVLLTTALVTAALLIGAAALISVSRQRIALQSGAVAEAQAQSALVEGQARLANGFLNANGEYGLATAASVTSVRARERGYQNNSECGALIADSSAGSINDPLANGDNDCPSYSVLIRRFLEPTIQGSARSYMYQVQDFVSGELNVIIRSTQGLQLFFIGQPALTGLNYQLCTDETDNNSCQGAQSGTNFTVIDAGTTVKRVRLTNAVLSGNPTDDALEVEHPNSTASFALSKGFTTVEATGIAPDGSIRRYLTVVRPSGTVTRALGDTFAPTGHCVPNPNACR